VPHEGNDDQLLRGLARKYAVGCNRVEFVTEQLQHHEPHLSRHLFPPATSSQRGIGFAMRSHMLKDAQTE
jgi:hypothetical protein